MRKRGFTDYERYALVGEAQWGCIQLPEDQIDPAILPLVRAMNIPGKMHTTASCAGHRGIGWPYVSFYTTLDIARGIHTGIWEYIVTGRTVMDWHLMASFNTWGFLVFRLEGRKQKHLFESPAITQRDVELLVSLVAEQALNGGQRLQDIDQSGEADDSHD